MLQNTIKVEAQNELGYVIIDSKDFDLEVHKLWSETSNKTEEQSEDLESDLTLEENTALNEENLALEQINLSVNNRRSAIQKKLKAEAV